MKILEKIFFHYTSKCRFAEGVCKVVKDHEGTKKIEDLED